MPYAESVCRIREYIKEIKVIYNADFNKQRTSFIW